MERGSRSGGGNLAGLYRQVARRAKRLAFPAAGALCAGVAMLAVGVCARETQAQTYPSRPIKMLIGFPPGGPADVPGRVVAELLSQTLAVPVIVENKPGAGSMLATNELISRPADGQTLLLCTYFDPVNTLLYKSARYKVADIAPISLIGTYDYALALSNTVPANSLSEIIAATKADPAKYNYGHIGVGSPANLIFKQLERLVGLKMTAVPFKGSAPAMQEVLAGRLDLYIVPPISVVQAREAKQAKVVAVTGKARLPVMPDVPTLQELGVPLVSFAFLGVCAASGTSEAIISTLNTAVQKVVAMATYRDLMTRLGSVPLSSSPVALQALMDEAVRDAAPVVSAFNLRMD